MMLRWIYGADTGPQGRSVVRDGRSLGLTSYWEVTDDWSRELDCHAAPCLSSRYPWGGLTAVSRPLAGLPFDAFVLRN